MKWIILVRLFVLMICVQVSGLKVLAQSSSSDAAEGIAALLTCGGCMTIPIIILALNIALLVWVARDAKNRAMDSAALWMLLVMFTGPIGLLIYLLSRPQGNLLSCKTCGNRRLQVSATCPHCGNS